jgi:hypothetical protein
MERCGRCKPIVPKSYDVGTDIIRNSRVTHLAMLQAPRWIIEVVVEEREGLLGR